MEKTVFHGDSHGENARSRSVKGSYKNDEASRITKDTEIVEPYVEKERDRTNDHVASPIKRVYPLKNVDMSDSVCSPTQPVITNLIGSPEIFNTQVASFVLYNLKGRCINHDGVVVCLVLEMTLFPLLFMSVQFLQAILSNL